MLINFFNARQTNGKNVLIRPENFHLVGEDSDGLIGKVDKVVFFGGFYELELLLFGKMITVRTRNAGIAKGDTVYVSLSPDEISSI